MRDIIRITAVDGKLAHIGEVIHIGRDIYVVKRIDGGKFDPFIDKVIYDYWCYMKVEG